MESITRFLAKRLRLKVNREKSAVARPWERKFLGYAHDLALPPETQGGTGDRADEPRRSSKRSSEGAGGEH